MHERDKAHRKTGKKDSIQERINIDPGFALHYAAENGDIDLAKLNLDSGKVDVNFIDGFGFTPLFRAVMQKQADFISFLLDRGADPNISTREGFTALMAAAESGNSRILKILLEHKADPDTRNIQGATSLHIAASLGHIEILTLLLASGADPSIRDNTDIKKILEQQTRQEIIMTDGDANDLKGLTACDVAKICGQTEAENLLKKIKS